MSTVKSNALQIGQSVTATNNFTWYQPASPDGTVRLGNGNSGSVTDLITVGSTGNLTLTGTAITLSNSAVISAASTKTLTLNGGGLTNGLVLDASNNVGIGISPSNASGYTTVDVSNATNGARIRCLIGGTAYGGMYTNGTTDFRVGSLAAVPLNIITGSNSIATFDTSGNLGLGVTPPSGATSNGMYFGSAGSTIGLGNGLQLAGNTYWDGAWKYRVSSTPANRIDINAGNAGVIGFFTAPSGTAGAAASFTQAMTLDASGCLGVGPGGTSPSSYGWITSIASPITRPLGAFYSNTASDSAYPCIQIGKYANDSTTANIFVRFFYNNLTNGGGQINANGAGAAAFGSFSDARLKENIVDLPPQLDSILALRPTEFDYIESEGGGHQIGFIAQEMEKVYPDAVGEREDGMKTITGWSKTEARLVKAIQELSAELNLLKQKVNA